MVLIIQNPEIYFFNINRTFFDVHYIKIYILIYVSKIHHDYQQKNFLCHFLHIVLNTYHDVTKNYFQMLYL